jgi:hypothetical protein
LVTLVRLAAAEAPFVPWQVAVSCGSDAVVAMAALDAGANIVIVDGSLASLPRLMAFAEQRGARVEIDGELPSLPLQGM